MRNPTAWRYEIAGRFRSDRSAHRPARKFFPAALEPNAAAPRLRKSGCAFDGCNVPPLAMRRHRICHRSHRMREEACRGAEPGRSKASRKVSSFVRPKFVRLDSPNYQCATLVPQSQNVPRFRRDRFDSSPARSRRRGSCARAPAGPHDLSRAGDAAPPSPAFPANAA